jgi:hypothetical protein
MIVVFAHTAGLTGAEVGVAADTGVLTGASVVSFCLLSTVRRWERGKGWYELTRHRFCYRESSLSSGQLRQTKEQAERLVCSARLRGRAKDPHEQAEEDSSAVRTDRDQDHWIDGGTYECSAHHERAEHACKDGLYGWRIPDHCARLL